MFAKEDIEFVQEHLPEVAMDNRYATLPIWSGGVPAQQRMPVEFQTAWSSTSAGNLTISGPLASFGARWRLNDRWQWGGFAFYDALDLRASREDRDLQTLFAPNTPIERPVAAQFSRLDGTATNRGLGFYAANQLDGGWLGKHEWLGGLLWQSVQLDRYRFDYRVQAGPSAGMNGTIDFDARYDHWVPFVGLALPRDHGNWTADAHVLLAYPLPRRGVAGHISGPGFDIHGNSAEAGAGKHFGDPSVTFGYTLTYRPAHLSIDLGSLATQALLESHIHRGIDRDVLVSCSIAF